MKPGTTDAVIAGNSAGVRVLCSKQALPVYDNLVKLAKTNHWARLVVSGICGLSSGRLNSKNVFVDKKAPIAYDKKFFYVVLPGVTATFKELDNGSYILQHLNADTNYVELQKATERPGLWRVYKDIDRKPDVVENGMIKNEKYRPVMIPDMSIDDPNTIALASHDDLIQVNDTIASMVRNDGFDLHYTPGGSGIVGLKRAEEALAGAKNRDIVKSATLLADTMFKARDIEGVLWYSDWGGSAVLTRALQILVREKGVKLENHSIFLNRPTSKPKQAIELAKLLGLQPLGKGKKTGLRMDEIRGHIMHTDVTWAGVKKAGKISAGAAGAGFALKEVGAVAVAGITAGGSMVLPAAGAVGLVGAMYFIGDAIKAGKINFKSKKYK